MDAGTQLAEIAGYIGDSSRASMLLSLVGGQSRPASELAMIANISPQAASNHLKMLVDGGLLDVTRAGRNKFYRLSGPPVAAALESLLGLIPAPAGGRGIAQRQRPELVLARTCYDHLAGELAVRILKHLLDQRFLEASGDSYALTGRGHAFFGTLGIDVTRLGKKRRRLAYPCLDWSHRVPHLGGALGAGLLDWLLGSHVVVRSKSNRAVRITDKGERVLERLFAIRLSSHRVSLARPS